MWPRNALAALVMVMGLLVLAGNTYAGPPKDATPESFGYFDFPTCVRYALVHSPYLLKSRIDIQVKSADLKDAHSELLPTIQLVTRYYFVRTGNRHYSPFNVEIWVPEWDPYLALMKIKSQKILVDIAKTAHMDKISENLAEMAKLFFRIHIIDRSLQARKQLIAFRRERVDYMQSRLKQGASDEVEVRLLENALKGEDLKLKDLEREKMERTADLKKLMGYFPDQQLPLDTRDAANQVLAGFNGQFITFADVQAVSRTLRNLAKQEQLQSNVVAGAYVALVPRPLLVIEGLANQPDRTSGVNVAMGMTYTLWDGFRRVRDIKRQKLKAEQAKIERDNRATELYNRFKNLLGVLQMCSAKDSFVREKIAVSELNEEKAFLLYKQGKTPGEPMTRAPGRMPGDSNSRDQTLPKDLYGFYLDRRLETTEAQLESIANAQDRVVTLIDLASIAGGLERYNARIRY
jgi:outer membrane protein TolC